MTTTTTNEYGLITQVVITTDTATIQVKRRNYARKYRDWNKLPRFYVWSDEPETIQDNLANRMRRPYLQWKKSLVEVFAEDGRWCFIFTRRTIRRDVS